MSEYGDNVMGLVILFLNFYMVLLSFEVVLLSSGLYVLVCGVSWGLVFY